MAENMVALLFTDLVNSTAIKNYLPGADITARNRTYRDTILLPHRRRVETSLPIHAGRSVETIGDAFFLVFPNPIQAVQWAVAIQLSHISDPISTPLGPLAVKIGIHIGSPLADGAQFIGQEVDYAARVGALATGEQILLSEATAASVRSAHLTGISLYDHGEHNLKGIGSVPIVELLYGDKQPHSIQASTAKHLSEFSSVIDWRMSCRNLLTAQKRLSTNSLTKGDGLGFELDQIYVPLGLVERKRQQKYSGDVSPEQGSLLYEPGMTEEIVQKFQQQEFFEQILCAEERCRIAIIGEPGAGKTTLLQKIALWVLDNTEDIPIWISLADLQGKTIEEYLLQDWLKTAAKQIHITAKMEAALVEVFSQGRVWLLLDALDEMVIESGNALAKLANQLLGWIGDARVILTCRLNVWDAGKNVLEAFNTYRNLDFSFGDTNSSDQVGQFIQAWFSDRPELAERLRTALDQPGRERIKDTVKNPLRLALLCRSWTRWQGELPNTRAGLYQQFIEALYEWKEDRFRTTSIQRNALNKALGRLALRAISQEKTRFRLRHRLVCEVLGEPDTELFQLALQLGFLNQVGVAAEAENRGERVYAFYHPTFQEYFAAQAISDWHEFFNHVPANPDRGTYHIFEPHWREVILLWLGRSDIPSEQKENFIEALVTFQDNCHDFYHYRAYFLAAVGIAELSNHQFADAIIQNIVQWSLGNVESDKLQKPVFLAPDREGHQVGSQGVQLTEARVKIVQRTSSYSLKKMADAALQETDRRRAITYIIERLQTQQQPQAIRQIVQLLGQLKTDSPEVVSTLIQLLNSAQDIETRLRAIESLGQIAVGSAEAIAALSQYLSSKIPEVIRYRVANCLGQVDPSNLKVVSTLVELFCTSADQSMRKAAAKSLGKIASGNSEAIAHVMPLVQSVDAEASCLEATQTLWHLDPGNSTVLETLTHLIHHSEDENIRRLSAQSLGQIDPGNEVAIEALVELLHYSQQEDIRYKAARILGLVAGNNPDAIAALLKVISNSEEAIYYSGRSTRYKAVQSLGEIGNSNTEVIHGLKHVLQTSDDEALRRQVAASLGQIEPGNHEALSALIHLIYTSEDHYTRAIAAYNLKEVGVGNASAVAALLHLLCTSPDDFARAQAAYSLKAIAHDNHLPGIVSSLKDFLTYQVYTSDLDLYGRCYDVIWHCAQTLSYQDFYRAWHGQRIENHPEIPEKRGIGSNSVTQTLNLADLPSLLATRVKQDIQLSQVTDLICIDGSKFIDPDNPAAEIYIDMVEQGCPERLPGEPTTMQAFKLYWKQLKGNKRRVLVFYTVPNQQEQQEFSPLFLAALSKCGGAISVITEQPLNHLPLKYFSRDQSTLLEDIIGWIREITFEHPS